MPAIKIEVQDQAVIEALTRLIRAGSELEPVLAAIGRQVKTHVQLGFVQGVDPYGRPWAPLKVRRGLRWELSAQLEVRVRSPAQLEGAARGTATVKGVL